MPNDVITLNAVASELDETLRGGRIEKIYQPETDEITLNVKNARILRTLVISANPSQPRIHISTQKKENSYTGGSGNTAVYSSRNVSSGLNGKL